MHVLKHPLFLSCVSGIALGLSWYPAYTALIFLGWIPLFLNVHFQIKHAKPLGFLFKTYTYAGFLVWNLISTWWVSFASFGGAVMAFTLNSLFMNMVFHFSIRFSLRRFHTLSFCWLIPIWTGWEFFHQQWELSWPWLNLGNAFSARPQWIQWYSILGSSAGTVWVLLVNIILFKAIIGFKTKLKIYKHAVLSILLIALPLLCSYLLTPKPFITNTQNIHVVCVQPNVDPYNFKFSSAFNTQFNSIWPQIKTKLKPETQLVVFPETFVAQSINLKLLKHSFIIQQFRDSIFKYAPKAHILSGLACYEVYEPGSNIPSTARETQDAGYFINYYNSAWWIDSVQSLIYHKSKLVPGSEIIPYSFLFKPLESMALDMGGTSGSLGTQNQRTVFTSKDSVLKIAPVICYESIYPDYATAYTRNGANVMCIITNDGWWENTPGYKQHLRYASLRAIENRRCIVRSANTGISAFIYPDGHIEHPTAWWTPDVIDTYLPLINTMSFFSKTGDWIGKTCMGTSIIILLLTILHACWLFLKRKLKNA